MRFRIALGLIVPVILAVALGVNGQEPIAANNFEALKQRTVPETMHCSTREWKLNRAPEKQQQFCRNRKLECYILDNKLKFDIQVLRNGVPFTRIYFAAVDRTELTNGECPGIDGNPLSDNVFTTSLFVDPTTNLLTDGSSCGIEVIESGKEYQFRIETEIEYERDRKGDIIFILNCHADFAAVDTISTIYAVRNPDDVTLNPPVETLQLRAVTTGGSDLPTTTLNDGTILPSVFIGNMFALQLHFQTTSASSATGATCKRLYVSVDNTYATQTDNLLNPDTRCPANSASGFLKPATGLKLVSNPAPNYYIYRTGAIQAAKYEKTDVAQATDILHFACEAEFCRQTQEQRCNDPCPAALGRKRRELEILQKSEFKKLVKRNSDKMITVDVKIETGKNGDSESHSMVIIWSLVGVACVIFAVIVVCFVVFCRVRKMSFRRSNAYKHQIDASSVSSCNDKIKGQNPVLESGVKNKF